MCRDVKFHDVFPKSITFYGDNQQLKVNGGSQSCYIFYVSGDNACFEERSLPFLKVIWGRLGNPNCDVFKRISTMKIKLFVFVL